MTPDSKTVRNQFKATLSSAMLLKEKFDRSEGLDIIQYTFEQFLKDLEYLKKLLPQEIIETGSLLRHVSWIERRLNENSPEQCYGDIHDICFNDLFYVQDTYMKSISKSEDPINDEIGIISKQLRLLSEPDCDSQSWLFTTERILKKIFPHDNINLSKHRTIRADLPFTTNERIRFREILNGLIQEIELNSKNLLPVDKWSKIHPSIARVAKSRFETDHFGDSVESAFKELNDIIKKAYVIKIGKEEDGDNLMRKSFSVNGPVFFLGDMATESGKNIQQGYMDIFAGSMKGIRNPKAHANMEVDPDEAWEMIVLGSHLMRMWEKQNK